MKEMEAVNPTSAKKIFILDLFYLFSTYILGDPTPSPPPLLCCYVETELCGDILEV
jgi:hypothetical protein